MTEIMYEEVEHPIKGVLKKGGQKRRNSVELNLSSKCVIHSTVNGKGIVGQLINKNKKRM